MSVSFAQEVQHLHRPEDENDQTNNDVSMGTSVPSTVPKSSILLSRKDRTTSTSPFALSSAPLPFCGTGHALEFDTSRLLRHLQCEIASRVLIWLGGFTSKHNNTATQSEPFTPCFADAPEALPFSGDRRRVDDMNRLLAWQSFLDAKTSKTFFSIFPLKAINYALKIFFHFLDTESVARKQNALIWLSQHSPSVQEFNDRVQRLKITPAEISSSSSSSSQDTQLDSIERLVERQFSQSQHQQQQPLITNPSSSSSNGDGETAQQSTQVPFGATGPPSGTTGSTSNITDDTAPAVPASVASEQRAMHLDLDWMFSHPLEPLNREINLPEELLQAQEGESGTRLTFGNLPPVASALPAAGDSAAASDRAAVASGAATSGSSEVKKWIDQGVQTWLSIRGCEAYDSESAKREVHEWSVEDAIKLRKVIQRVVFDLTLNLGVAVPICCVTVGESLIKLIGMSIPIGEAKDTRYNNQTEEGADESTSALSNRVQKEAQLNLQFAATQLMQRTECLYKKLVSLQPDLLESVVLNSLPSSFLYPDESNNNTSTSISAETAVTESVDRDRILSTGLNCSDTSRASTDAAASGGELGYVTPVNPLLNSRASSTGQLSLLTANCSGGYGYGEDTTMNTFEALPPIVSQQRQELPLIGAVSAASSCSSSTREQITLKLLCEKINGEIYTCLYFLINLMHRSPIAVRTVLEYTDQKPIQFFLKLLHLFIDARKKTLRPLLLGSLLGNSSLVGGSLVEATTSNIGNKGDGGFGGFEISIDNLYYTPIVFHRRFSKSSDLEKSRNSYGYSNATQNESSNGTSGTSVVVFSYKLFCVKGVGHHHLEVFVF